MSDDFDLEQELLQVAGRSKAAGKKRSRKTAYSDSEGDDDLAGGFSEEEHDDLFGSDDDDDRPKSKKKPKAAAKRATKKRNASPSPEADGVASDGDEDEPQEKYPLEGKFIDEEDRARLMSMNELDRELELAQRQEEVDKMKQTMRLRQQAKAASRKPARQSNRQRNKGASEKDDAMRTLVAARQRKEAAAGKAKAAAKGKRGGAKGRAAARAKGGWSDDDSDVSLSDEEDEERSEEGEPSGGRRRAGRRPSRASALDGRDEEEEDEEEVAGSDYDDDRRGFEAGIGEEEDEEDDEAAGLPELLPIQLRREQLEAWHDQPFLDTLAGCLVRAHTTEVDPLTGKSAGRHRLMLVTGFARRPDRPYYLDSGQSVANAPGRRAEGAAVCDVYVETRYGNVPPTQRNNTFTITVISNGPLTEEELSRWEVSCRGDKSAMISRRMARTARAALDEAQAFRYTGDVVKQLLAAKREKGLAYTNKAAERRRLRALLHTAQTSGDVEEEARLTAALEALEEGGGDGQAGRGGDSRDHSRMYGVQRINRAAMKHNTLMSFRGVTARPDGGDKGGGGGTSAADPFSRRATGNKVYWKAGNAAAAKARADAEAAAAAKELEVQKALMRESVAHAALTSAQSRMDPVELLRQVDLHIDDSLLQEEAAAAAAAQHGGSGLAMARKLLGRAWLSRGGGAAAGSALPPELAGGSVLSLDEYLSTRRTGMLFGQ